MKAMCEVEGCGEELSEGTGSKGGPLMCPSCRTSSYYWKKQSLPQMRFRHERLVLFAHRMEHFDPRVTKIVNEAKRTVAENRKKAQDATNGTRH